MRAFLALRIVLVVDDDNRFDFVFEETLSLLSVVEDLDDPENFVPVPSLVTDMGDVPDDDLRRCFFFVFAFAMIFDNDDEESIVFCTKWLRYNLFDDDGDKENLFAMLLLVVDVGEVFITERDVFTASFLVLLRDFRRFLFFFIIKPFMIVSLDYLIVFPSFLVLCAQENYFEIIEVLLLEVKFVTTTTRASRRENLTGEKQPIRSNYV